MQVREAVESEKARFQQQIEHLTESLAEAGEKISKMEERTQQLLEERSTLMSKQKELHWERDQDNKRLAREIQRLNEKAAQEKAD